MYLPIIQPFGIHLLVVLHKTCCYYYNCRYWRYWGCGRKRSIWRGLSATRARPRTRAGGSAAWATVRRPTRHRMGVLQGKFVFRARIFKVLWVLSVLCLGRYFKFNYLRGYSDDSIGNLLILLIYRLSRQHHGCYPRNGTSDIATNPQNELVEIVILTKEWSVHLSYI